MFTDEKYFFLVLFVQYEFSLRERCVKLRFWELSFLERSFLKI